MNGVPKEIVLSQRQISESLAEPAGAIIDAVKAGLENTAPELAADIVDKGIVLVGGRALLANLNQVLWHATGFRFPSRTGHSGAWRWAPDAVSRR